MPSLCTHIPPLALAAAALAEATKGNVDGLTAFPNALTQVQNRLKNWHGHVAATQWLEPGARYSFLGRGPSQASCYQTRLLWEEGAKSAATAMNTSGFRHGPQEAVFPGMRIGLFLDPVKMREQDLAVADDLKKLGASVMLVG